MSDAESGRTPNLVADLEKLPPIFPPKTLEEWSQQPDGTKLLTERRLGDMRRAKQGPAFVRVPGGRQIIYTRAAVAEWLTANMSAQIQHA